MKFLRRLHAVTAMRLSARLDHLSGRKRRKRYLQPLTPAEEFSHIYCIFLHDQMVRVIADVEQNNLVSVRVHFTEQAHAEEMSKVPRGDIADWLDSHGYGEAVDELMYRQIAHGLLADFCHFIYEAFANAAKGKLTVTYALLRKPLKDNLFYLEWMLADREGFLAAFRDDASAMVATTTEKRRDVIATALAKTRTGEWIDPGFLYDLRYDKAAAWGFEQSWQKAHHLVTTSKHYTTDQMNFNFIFSDDEARKTQVRFLHSFMPPILFYALEVASGVIQTFDESIVHDETSWVRRLAGLSLNLSMCPDEAAEVLSQGINRFVDGAELTCDACGQVDATGEQYLLEVYLYNATSCPRCGRLIRFD